MSETAAQKKARLAKEKAAKETLTIDMSALPSLSGNTGISPSSVDWTSASFDVSGMGLNLPAKVNPTKVNATQLYNALVKAANDNPSLWLPIKYALSQSHFYTSTPSFVPGFTNDDKTAVQNFMSTLIHKNTDLPQGQTATPVLTFLSQTQQMANLYGGAAARTQVQKVVVPNPLDLNKISDVAFRTALGRAPSAKEQKAFVNSYTQQIMAVSRATAAQAALPTLRLPSAAANNTAMTPVTPNQAMGSIQQNAMAATKAPSTVLKTVQAAPDAPVAASEFARKADPTRAGVIGANDAISSWLQSLGGKGLP